MGPRPAGRGIPALPSAFSANVIRFNGAATSWPRNYDLGGGDGLVIGGFNGAATSWPRNSTLSRFSLTCLARLQWGRDQLAAEFRPGPRPTTAERSASMGPRPAGRGIACDCRARAYSSTLQWGRDQLAAELNQWVTIAGNSFSLQWGRDQLAAEFLPKTATGELDKVASMGPRPAGRGIDQRPPVHLHATSVLQWGRDQLAAELLRRSDGLTTVLDASMGPRPAGRGISPLPSPLLSKTCGHDCERSAQPGGPAPSPTILLHPTRLLPSPYTHRAVPAL